MDFLTTLLTSGQKFRKDILVVPVAQLEPTIKHMTLRTGIRGKETVGELSDDAQLRPYKTAKNAIAGGTVNRFVPNLL